MIYFVGAGCGAPDLITVRGMRLIQQADVIIYAGSLVNPELLQYTKESAAIHNSAYMNLNEIIQVMNQAENQGKLTVRLHTGDPSIYGAIQEQMHALDRLHLPYEICPGVSSFCGAAAELQVEYTIPNVSQTVILTRMEGRTPVPKLEKIRLLASHHATMIIFLSASLIKKLTLELIEGGYSGSTPAAIVYKATWEDQKIIRCTIESLEAEAEKNQITKTALILIGDFLQEHEQFSCLYDAAFETEFRKATK